MIEHFKYNDAILNLYYSEMVNDNNDGWAKNHYKELYEKRLKNIIESDIEKQWDTEIRKELLD